MQSFYMVPEGMCKPHSFDIHYRQKSDIICNTYLHHFFSKTCQIAAGISSKLTIMVINLNFEPLLRVLMNFLLQLDKFFKKIKKM